MTRTLLRFIPDGQTPPVCPQPVMAEEKERADVPFPRLMLHNWSCKNGVPCQVRLEAGLLAAPLELELNAQPQMLPWVPRLLLGILWLQTAKMENGPSCRILPGPNIWSTDTLTERNADKGRIPERPGESIASQTGGINLEKGEMTFLLFLRCAWQI